MTSGGFLLTAEHAMTFAAVWLVLVLGYGLVRSRGSAAPDVIRPSGPLPGE